MEFDCIVIGKGLIGSAAAKYLSDRLERVAVIGPDEPLNIREGIVFSSHYDQARIQRIIGTDATWTRLNQQSANAYAAMQEETGINFHSAVGCLFVNPHGVDSYLRQVEHLSEKVDTCYELMDSEGSLGANFPDFNFPSTSKGIFEEGAAGFINPGSLISAQLNLFKKNGGTIIKEIVAGVSPEGDAIKIVATQGNIFTSEKVLVAAGAFTNSLNLLPVKLFFKLKSESTVWAKVTKEEAMRLKKLPSLLYEIDTPEIQNIYLIQPVLYPDGEYYLKMGANIPEDIYFETLEKIQEWFRTVNPQLNLPTLQDALRRLMPGLQASELVTKNCIVTRTAHGKPYIGPLNEKGIFVAAGGNGYGAMCSDALAKLASDAVTDKAFPKEFASEEFLPKFKDEALA